MSNSSTPRATVTIPVYNGMPFIESAIESVISQLGATDELVVIDNASTDGTTDYLRSLSDNRLRLVVRDSTQDVAANWTQAIRESQGKYVKLMCADDVLLPGTLDRQVALLEHNTDCAAVTGRRRIIGPGGGTIKANHGLGPLVGVVQGVEAIKECARSGTNLLGEPVCFMFDRQAILDGMPWEIKHPYLLDLATYAKGLSTSSIVCEPNEVACFRVSAGSWSANILRDQPRDFKAWRKSWLSTSNAPWSTRDAIVADLFLSWRTMTRWATFLGVKVAARARS